MPKTTTAGMDTHLAGTTTSLAALWLITRTDGTLYRFTDHDTKIVFGGNTYVASSAFTSTTIQYRSDLSITNLDVDSIFEDAQFLVSHNTIAVEDLRDGFFDFAEIRISFVNWRQPDTDGEVIMFFGHLGEISIKGNAWKGEARGLSQRLIKRVGSIYTPDCRADHFGPECNNTAVNPAGDLPPANFRESSFVDVLVSQREFDLPNGATRRLRMVDENEGQLDDGVIWSPPSTFPTTGGPAVLKLVQVSGALIEDGTPRRPFIVATTTDLNNIRNNVNAHYALSADIDMVAFGVWTPIPAFNGGLDGRGHKIINIDSDLVASATPNGLFEDTLRGSIIRRLGIEGSDFRGTGTGVRRACFAATHRGLILDCYAFNNTLDGNVMGGIVSNLVAGDTTNYRGGALVRCWAANIMGTGAAGVDTNGLIISAGLITQQTIISCYGDAAYSQDNAGVEIDSTNSGVNPAVDGGSLSRTTAQMKTRSTYDTARGLSNAGTVVPIRYTAITLSAFAFGTPWRIDDGNDYPRLIEVTT